MTGVQTCALPIFTAYPGWPLAVNKRLGGVEAASLWYWQSLFKNVYVK